VTTLPAGHPFRKHSENLRAVKAGLIQAQRAHKGAIRRSDAAGIDFTERIHEFMVGMLAEAWLRKIISDPDGFNLKEQRLLGQERGQLDTWLRTVEFAIRRHYSVPLHLEIDDSRTAPGVTAQYDTVIDILKSDLSPVIGDRNKLAHAQWKWLLNHNESAFTRAANSPLNYLASKRRGDVIALIANLIHTLSVSEPTFQRDYSAIYKKITAIQVDINGHDYPDFARELLLRRQAYLQISIPPTLATPTST
jgi:hypothetical protein